MSSSYIMEFVWLVIPYIKAKQNVTCPVSKDHIHEHKKPPSILEGFYLYYAY